MRRLIAAIQVFGILFWQIPLGKADDSDIFGTNVQPNVLILFDDSGSMDEYIQSAAYDPNGTYAGSYVATKVYKYSCFWALCSYNVYADNVSGVGNATAQTVLSSVGFWSGSIGGSPVQLYMGKYLNYRGCSTCPGSRKKIDIAKEVVNNIVQNTQGVRFGVMKFQQWPMGATMVAPIGTDAGTITSAVNTITPNGFTPLGEMLRDAGNYLRGSFGGYSSPIQLSCQPNFAILITDGKQTGSLDVSAQADALYKDDLSTTLSGQQNLITHTVGFGLAADDAVQATAELQDTAAKGGGTYYNANNSAQLEQALQSAIRQIIAATFSFATPVVPTTSTSGGGRAYVAAFQSNASRPFWRGYLKAYQLDANGMIPTDASGVPTGHTWDAGQLLSERTPADRKVYAYVADQLRRFERATSQIDTAILGVATSTERDKVIDFTLGIDSYDEDADSNTTEQRAWKLGDIFHSTPVVVSRPSMPLNDVSYTAFKDNNATRIKIVLAGANDGMLHAFRESDGRELWAFIPQEALDDLKDIAVNSGQHDFTVDGSPVVVDMKDGETWKTIVVFGLRRGGVRYYALDITTCTTEDTCTPQWLWSFSDARMGETWSEPAVGKVRLANGTVKYVGFVGGGYNTASNNSSGKAFFAIDLSNGSKLWEYYNSTTADDRRYMNYSLTAAPTSVDLNDDGYVDRVYIGDVGGQLWKFDVNPAGGTTTSGTVVNNWTGKRIFAAASSQANPPAPGEYYPAQAIYVPPTLSYDLQGNLWVYFGTGDRNHPNNTSTNRFYGIKENTTMDPAVASLTEAALTDVSSGSGVVTQGWYIILSSNEKVLAAADVFNKAVLFTTFTPVSTVSCNSGGGNAKLYAVNINSGSAAINLSTGELLPANQRASDNAKAIGTGIPSRPLVIVRQSGNMGNPLVITGTTNQQITNTPVPQIAVRKLVGWREVLER
jgi:type IV pilus assembly protein PilY1